MPFRLFSPRSKAMALRRIAVLSALAIAAGAGIFLLVRRAAERSAATAVLSFDPAVAARNDAAISQAAQPAVAEADSMLTEAAILDVLRRAGAPVSDPAVDIGEFRSRLDLEEPSVETLRVRYYDPDSRQARIIVNTVASAIANWTPLPSAPSAAPAPPAPQPIPARPPHVAPPPVSAGEPHDRLRQAYLTLADLEGRLAATDEEIGDLIRQPAAPGRPANPAPPTAAQTQQRRSLQAQLAAAHQKLDDLRAHDTDENPDVEATRAAIARLQHELAAFPLPATPYRRPTRSSEPQSHGAEIAQLSAQRGLLINQIAVQTRTIVLLRAHPATHETASPPQPAPALPAQPAPAPPVPAVAAAPVWQTPFRITRLAGSASSSLAWPTVLASLLCALFCAAAALGLFLYWRRAIEATRPAVAAPAEAVLPPAALAAAAEPETTAPEPPEAAPQSAPESSALAAPVDAVPVGAVPVGAPSAGADPHPEKPEPELEPQPPDRTASDADWNAFILNTLSHTSIGQKVERDRLAGPSRSPAGPSAEPVAEAGETEPSHAMPRQESSENKPRPQRMTDPG
jgi:hypothetical protein